MNATTRRHRGFTLIELMFTVALIAVMIAIAVPSFASFISNYRTTSAVNDLLEAISLTRSEALKRGRRVTLIPNNASRVPSATGNWVYGWTVFVDMDNNQVMSLGNTIPDVLIAQHDVLPATMTATASPDAPTGPFSGNNLVIFDGSGYPRTATGGSLKGGIVLTDHLGSQVNVRTLCLGLFGRPQIIKTIPPAASPSCT